MYFLESPECGGLSALEALVLAPQESTFQTRAPGKSSLDY